MKTGNARRRAEGGRRKDAPARTSCSLCTSFPLPPSALRLSPSFPLPPSALRLRAGFTLVELLVALVVISILVAISWGGLQKVNEFAREAATKGTIAKIDHFHHDEAREVQDAAGAHRHVGHDPRKRGAGPFVRHPRPDADGDARLCGRHLPRATVAGRTEQSAVALVGVPAKGTPNSSAPNQAALDSAKCLYMTVITGDGERGPSFGRTKSPLIRTAFNISLTPGSAPSPGSAGRWAAAPRSRASSTGRPTLPGYRTFNRATPRPATTPSTRSTWTNPPSSSTPLIVSSGGHLSSTTKGQYDYGVNLDTAGPTVTPFSNTSVGACSRVPCRSTTTISRRE